jgi:hypothetical protein
MQINNKQKYEFLTNSVQTSLKLQMNFTNPSPSGAVILSLTDIAALANAGITGYESFLVTVPF